MDVPLREPDKPQPPPSAAPKKRTRRFLRWGWLWALVLGGCTLGAWLVYREADRAMDASDPDRARSQGRPIPVRTALVTATEFEQVIGATVMTTSSSDAVIRAISPGQGTNTVDMIVKTIHVREGDWVRQGQVAFEIEEDVRSDVVARMEANLGAVEAEMKRLEQGLELRERARKMELASAEANMVFRTADLQNRLATFEVVEKVYRERATTPIELSDARSRLEQARYQLKEGQERLQLAKDALILGPLQDRQDLSRTRRDVAVAWLDLKSARRDVGWCQVKSPIEGFIDSRIEISPGQVLSVTSNLAHVVTLDPMHVRLDFPQERMDEVAVGQQTEIVLDSFPKETFQGKVIRIGPVVNPALRVFAVVVEMQNPGNRVKAGVSGFARVKVKRQAVAIPAAAVIRHGSKAMVFRVEEGRARLREVQVKHPIDLGMLEVSGGVSAGDEVVIYFSNFYRHWRELTSRDCYLQDNDPVDVEWRKWARRD
jgi:multidrug efflux pump subunit AcrA (membrane-fusion protein)